LNLSARGGVGGGAGVHPCHATESFKYHRCLWWRMNSAIDILNKYKAKMSATDFNELLAIMIANFAEAVEKNVETTAKVKAQMYNVPSILQGAYSAYGNEFSSETSPSEIQIINDKWQARGLDPAVLLKIRNALK